MTSDIHFFNYVSKCLFLQSVTQPEVIKGLPVKTYFLNICDKGNSHTNKNSKSIVTFSDKLSSNKKSPFLDF
jgi:hypothetical protein